MVGVSDKTAYFLRDKFLSSRTLWIRMDGIMHLLHE